MEMNNFLWNGNDNELGSYLSLPYIYNIRFETRLTSVVKWQFGNLNEHGNCIIINL